MTLTRGTLCIHTYTHTTVIGKLTMEKNNLIGMIYKEINYSATYVRRPVQGAMISSRHNSEKHENNTTYNTKDDAIFSTDMHTSMNGTTQCLHYYDTNESE